MRIRESDRKYKDKTFGWGQEREDLEKEQQQACVAASATIGALLPYICRRDDRNARIVQVAAMTADQLTEHVAASSRSLPIAHTQRSRPLPPPAGTESRIH